jgi:hypothetical protein
MVGESAAAMQRRSKIVLNAEALRRKAALMRCTPCCIVPQPHMRRT